MHPDEKFELNSKELMEIEASLTKGMVHRASVLAFLFAGMFFCYAFTSLDFLKLFDPSITLWNNLWPRLVFNVLPLAALGVYFRKYNDNYRVKAWLWALGQPLIFMIACLIHVWPIIYSGKPDLFPFVHGANLFILAITFLAVTPPPKIMLAQVLALAVTFILPMTFLLYRTGNALYLNLMLGDVVLAVAASAYASHLIFKLRAKVALMDRQMRKMATPFLGKELTNAIYSQRADLMEARKSQATVVLMDIRGYTDFYKSVDPEIVRKFMTEYHSMVSRHIGQHGGYWHKSIGDAQLASFGAMNREEDLSDIPGIETDLEEALQRKNKLMFESVLKSIFSIAYQFERLKEKFDVQNSISLGIGAAYGEIEIRVQGDGNFRNELDIDGKVIIRSARLEAYSKLVRSKLAPESSVLVLSPEMQAMITDERLFKVWEIDSPALAVPNFPEITHVLYHVFRDSDERRERILTLRAS